MDDIEILGLEVARCARAVAGAIHMVEHTDDRAARAEWEAEVQHLSATLAQARRRWVAAGGRVRLVGPT